jgi:SAM-dependent methyltransferase
MNPAEYERMHALEDWYWWFVARRRAVADFIQSHAPAGKPVKILDAGCGTGAMLDLFAKWPDVEATGADLSPEALRFSSERGHERLVSADLTDMPFPPGSFDVVTALDVLEHVPDDKTAAAEIARVLRPGGVLVATVPAYMLLWGPHDEALHHQRRYSARQLRELIRDAGLEQVKLTFLFTGLFPVAAAMRLVSKMKPKGEPSAALPAVPEWLNRILINLHAAELGVARKVGLPFGLSLLVVARRPGA